MMHGDRQQQLTRELSDMFGNLVSVEPISEFGQSGANLVVCNMGYRVSSADRSGPDRHIRQTAIVLDAEKLDLPEFSLAPHRRGILGKLAASLGAFVDINFDDSPEFSDAYHLHGWAEEPVRVLFTESLRNHFAQHTGWSVRGKGSRLVVFRYDRVCDAAARDDFVQDTLRILALFREAESELDARPEIRRNTTAQDVQTTAARMGGLAGAMLQNQLRKISVTKEELAAFLSDSVPRRIPPGLRRQVLGDTFVLVIVGVLFCVVGLIVGSGLFFLSREGRMVGLILLLTLPVMGGLLAGLTIRHRLRKTRVLRNGTVTAGTVAGVAGSGVMVNNQLRHVATVRYSVNGQDLTTTCHVYGTAANLARSFEASGEPVNVLVDPVDSRHVVCTDFLTIFD